MPNICQRLGIPGFTLNRKLLNHENGLAWVAETLRDIASDMPIFIADGVDTLDTRINKHLMEEFGAIPPLLLVMDHDQPSNKSIAIYAPGAVPIILSLHALIEEDRSELMRFHAKTMRDKIHEAALANTVVTDSAEYFATALKLTLYSIADSVVSGKLPNDTEHDDDDISEKRALREVIGAVRSWHAAMLAIARGEIHLDRAALRIGRMVRLTKERWPDAKTTCNPLIAKDMLDDKFGPIEDESPADLHLDAIEALKIVEREAQVEIVASPREVVNDIYRITTLTLSQKLALPLVTMPEPFVYQTHEVVLVAGEVPEMLKGQLTEAPLEQLYTSAFTDGLGIVIERVGDSGFSLPQDWHNHYGAHYILNNQRVGRELPIFEIEKHLETNFNSYEHVQDGAVLAPSTAIEVRSAEPMVFKLNAAEALAILDDFKINPRNTNHD